MSDALEILKWQLDAGVDIAIGEAPVNRFAISETGPDSNHQTNARHHYKPDPSPNSALAKRLSKDSEQPATPSPIKVDAVALPDEDTILEARTQARTADSIDELKAILEKFEGCNLRRSAKNLVFADGNPQADIMFVGEAPGRDEDLHGLPFVGRSGQLLDKMMAAINLSRDTAYITNVIPWRPPGNRPPTPTETELCLPFIERHIELVNPKVLVMLGGSSAKTLLKTTDGILRLRGKWKTLEIGNVSMQAMATLHPAYLLRQTGQKKLAWQDFLKIRMELEGSQF